MNGLEQSPLCETFVTGRSKHLGGMHSSSDKGKIENQSIIILCQLRAIKCAGKYERGIHFEGYQRDMTQHKHKQRSFG